VEAKQPAAPSRTDRWDPAASPVGFVVWAVVFTLAYTLLPVFAENQHTKCLAGLARAGMGFLARDWLAGTTDPFPLFTTLVEWTYRATGTRGFYLWPVLLFGAYLAGCSLLARALLGDRRAAEVRLPFLAAVVVSHSALLRLAAESWTGFDVGWAVQSGVAYQYILGPVLQPAMFGVLLVLGLGLAGVGRPAPALAAFALAALAHPAYLVVAAILGVGVAVADGLERRRFRPALALAVVVAAAALSVAALGASRLGPTSAAAWKLATQAQLYLRMPHHTLPRVFFNAQEAVKLLWMLLGLALVGRHRVAAPLLLLGGAAAVASAAAVVTGSEALELAQPWRVVAVLVPVATAVLLARAMAWLGDGECRLKALRGAALAAVAAAVVGGGVLQSHALARRAADPAQGVFAWVRDNVRAGDLYLVPVAIPAPRFALPASLAAGVREALRWRGAARDLEGFRLATGAPALVTFKSNPIRDVEVAEWLRRLELAARFYDPASPAAGETLGELVARYGVTHVVIPRGGRALPPGVEIVYQDAEYVVGRVTQAAGGGAPAATAR